MEADDAALRAHYELGMERERLSDGRGDLEFTRTSEIVLRRLPTAPAVVADIGGGPGRYALWLASLGYQVEHRDLMPLHVEQLRAEAAGVAGIHTAVGDVRDLDLPDASVDAVLLLGPLYHLIDRAERVRALRECARIVRPGGAVFAAVISRWAVRIDGTLRERIYLKYPAVPDLMDEIDRTGILPPLGGGADGRSGRPVHDSAGGTRHRAGTRAGWLRAASHRHRHQLVSLLGLLVCGRACHGGTRHRSAGEMTRLCPLTRRTRRLSNGPPGRSTTCSRSATGSGTTRSAAGPCCCSWR